jgi:hypothetical protein
VEVSADSDALKRIKHESADVISRSLLLHVCIAILVL